MVEIMSTSFAVIDESAALAALDGNRQLLCELAVIFVEDAPVLLHNLDEAIAADQADVAQRVVHSIKGLSSTFYAKSTIELAGALEECLRVGTMDPLRNGGAEQLKHSVEELSKHLRKCGLAS